MKYRVSFIVILTIFILSLSACGNGIKGDEAKEHINGFFEAIESEDYEKAEDYLHPDRPVPLDEFFTSLESDLTIDFQSGIEIDDYTGMSSALYDSTVEGSTYSLNMDVLVGDSKLKIEIELVRNDNGFGIYNFDIGQVPKYLIE